MQMRDATELRKQWGDRPCSHPRLTKEYDLGAHTGDWVCTTCGETGWGPNWNHKDGNKPEED
jgi:hypothetical protein